MSSDIRFRSTPSRPSRRKESSARWYWWTTGVDKADLLSVRRGPGACA